MFDMSPTHDGVDLPPVERRRENRPQLYLGFEQLGRDNAQIPGWVRQSFARWSRARHPNLSTSKLFKSFRQRETTRPAIWLLHLEEAEWQDQRLWRQFGLLLLRDFYRNWLYVELGGDGNWVSKQAVQGHML